MQRTTKRSNKTQLGRGSGLLVAAGVAGIGVVVVALVSLVVAIVQRAPQRGLAQLSPAALSTGQISGRGTFSFTEDFATDTLKDTSTTTAKWDTSTGTLVPERLPASFYRADGSTGGADNVTGGVGLGSSPPVVTLDSSNRPYIVWSSALVGNSEIFFSYWDGSTWTGLVSPGADNLSNSAVFDGRQCVGLDANDNPLVAWMPGGGVVVAHWNGSAWVQSVLDSSVSATECDIATNPVTNQPAIFWTRGDNTAWYRAFDGTNWSVAENVVASGVRSDSNAPSLVFDVNGVPHVVWRTNTDVMYGNKLTGSWSSGEVVVSPGSTPNNASLAVNDSGTPTVAWDTVTQLGFTQRVLGTWQTLAGAPGSEILDSFPPSFTFGGDHKLDELGRPIVTWYVATPAVDTKILTWNGTAWVGLDGSAGATILDTALGAGDAVSPNLAVDTCGFPNLAFNPSGAPVDVYFTHWFEPTVVPAQAQSLTVDATPEPILTATLSIAGTSGNSPVNYYLSNNGGTTFESVTPGLAHAFNTIGSDLRWRIELLGQPDNLPACPSINALTLDFSTEPVVRISADSPTDIAVAVSQASFPVDHSAPVAILGRSDNLVDEFVATPLVSRTEATLLLTSSSGLDSATLAELQRALVPGGTVYLLGGEVALTPQVATDLTDNGFAVQKRLGGARRFDTSTAIAVEINNLQSSNLSTKAFLTESDFLVDAFSAGPVAGNKTGDNQVDFILLTERGKPTLNAATADFLETQTQLTNVELIGGSTALSPSLESQATKALPAVTVTRYQGANRYATGKAVNDKYFPDPTAAIIANGEGPHIPGSISSTSTSGSGLFGALLAGAYASKLASPLILTQVDTLPAESSDYLTSHAATLTSATIVGALADVGQVVEDQVRSIF